jgi:hypothetical protein
VSVSKCRRGKRRQKSAHSQCKIGAAHLCFLFQSSDRGLVVKRSSVGASFVFLRALFPVDPLPSKTSKIMLHLLALLKVQSGRFRSGQFDTRDALGKF